jgi:hypothetical protein
MLDHAPRTAEKCLNVEAISAPIRADKTLHPQASPALRMCGRIAHRSRSVNITCR